MTLDKMTITELSAFLDCRKELSPEEVDLLETDQRRGAVDLLRRFQRRNEKRLKEEVRLQKMLTEEKILWSMGYKAVAGVDEAGRGPLAGPVVAAAVIFAPGKVINNLNDSKQLSAAMREKLFELIIQEAEAYGIGSASREEIDRINIHGASMLAMRRALERLCLPPDFVLVDGFPIRHCDFRQKAIKGGDTLSLSIAAASVLAKVARDKIMTDLHLTYPRYNFDQNKGYGTFEHRAAISKHGPCPEHRRSFRLTDY